VEAAGLENPAFFTVSAADSEEDPDLANADADEPASEASHKPGPDGAPYIDPGQLTVFDLLDGPSNEYAG
jgi:hypothetical protein